MGLFKRLQDILSANMGEMVETFEDPEPMLKQAIREMEAAVGEGRQETAKAIASEKLVRKELAAYGAGLADKPELVALNKMDAVEAKALAAKTAALTAACGAPPHVLSAVTGQGVRALLRSARKAFAAPGVETPAQAEGDWRP